MPNRGACKYWKGIDSWLCEGGYDRGYEQFGRKGSALKCNGIGNQCKHYVYLNDSEWIKRENEIYKEKIKTTPKTTPS